MILILIIELKMLSRFFLNLFAEVVRACYIYMGATLPLVRCVQPITDMIPVFVLSRGLANSVGECTDKSVGDHAPVIHRTSPAGCARRQVIQCRARGMCSAIV